jgi:hypothetical protein
MKGFLNFDKDDATPAEAPRATKPAEQGSSFGPPAPSSGSAKAMRESMRFENPTIALLAGHPATSLREIYAEAGIDIPDVVTESQGQASSRQLAEMLEAGEAHDANPMRLGLGDWIRQRNTAPGDMRVIRRMRIPKFIGHRPDGSTYEF